MTGVTNQRQEWGRGGRVLCGPLGKAEKKRAPREVEWRDNCARAEHPEEGNYKAKGEACCWEVPSCIFSGCE